METLDKNNYTTMATLIHFSTFSKYLFPFGNFIIPLILWAFGKKNHFVDENAKQALNFQISLFLYYLFISGVAISSALIVGYQMDLAVNISYDSFYISDGKMVIPFAIILGVAGILILGLFILDIVSTITATMKASENVLYKYPLSIPFLRSSNQSEIEQLNNNVKNETL